MIHAMATDRMSLRERNAVQARVAIVEAAADRLAGEDPDDINLAELAGDAGVSLRTLYRYFPTRDELLAAAGDRLYARLGVRDEVGEADGVSASFLAASAALAEQPEVARNLLRTTLGRQVRLPHRQERVREIHAAVGREAGRRAGDTAVELAGAAVAYLCSSASWITVCDESELSPDDARAAVAWAIDMLVDAVRDGRLPEPPTKKRGKHR